MICGTLHTANLASPTMNVHTSNERYDSIYQITGQNEACSPRSIVPHSHSGFRATITIASIFIHAPLLHSTTAL